MELGGEVVVDVVEKHWGAGAGCCLLDAVGSSWQSGSQDNQCHPYVTVRITTSVRNVFPTSSGRR